MNIIISGGNFGNKGAQAMVFIALNECIQRFPDAKYVLQLSDSFREVASIDELNQIVLEREKNKQSGKSNNRKKGKLLKMISVYKNADIMIDISGYELSSKLGVYPTLRYLFKIALSKWNKADVYLMPQSFGPFSYSGILKPVLKILISHYMKYPKVCYAREKDSLSYLKGVAPKANVVSSNDLVLQNKQIEKLLCEVSLPEEFLRLPDNCVGVVPNNRLVEQCGKEITNKCYHTVISTLRQLGYTVCLICHADGDLKSSKKIKEEFSDDEGVVFIDRVLSCFEYQVATQNFKFIVAARYHSIVHAYKACIPAIALGWAVKYQELLGLFSQSDYAVNVKDFDAEDVGSIINQMSNRYEQEAEKIQNGLLSIQSENCFDIINN